MTSSPDSPGLKSYLYAPVGVGQILEPLYGPHTMHQSLVLGRREGVISSARACSGTSATGCISPSVFTSGCCSAMNGPPDGDRHRPPPQTYRCAMSAAQIPITLGRLVEEHNPAFPLDPADFHLGVETLGIGLDRLVVVVDHLVHADPVTVRHHRPVVVVAVDARIMFGGN